MIISICDSCCDTGIKALDQDHKDIINLMNLFYGSIKRNNKYEDILFLGDKLNFHINMHGQKEEKFMAQIKYPDIEYHIIEHKIIKEENSKLLLRIKQKTPGSTIGLYYILRELLVEHVEKIDMQLANYYFNNMNKESLRLFD